MKISVRSRYGIKAMVDLAINGTTGPVPLKQIAERQGISERYLERVFSLLKKSGLVDSIKGPQGGYELSFEPKKITMKKLLETLEGNLSFSEAQDNEDILDECIIELLWTKVDESIIQVIQELTLLDLVEDYKKKTDSSKYMYYI